MAHGICEGTWLKQMLNEIRIPINYTMRIFCDNKAAISIGKNPVHHNPTKHVEIDRHFIKEKIDHKIISVKHVPSCQPTVDGHSNKKSPTKECIREYQIQSVYTAQYDFCLYHV